MSQDERTGSKDQKGVRDQQEHADLQDGSLKKHGDVLDPVIPRGADQKAGESESNVSEEGRGARGTPER